MKKNFDIVIYIITGICFFMIILMSYLIATNPLKHNGDRESQNIYIGVLTIFSIFFIVFLIKSIQLYFYFNPSNITNQSNLFDGTIPYNSLISN